MDAARKIFSENILGGTCARVCPVEVLCEGRCVLKDEGRHPIRIGSLQRHATEAAFAAGATVTAPVQGKLTGPSVGVIGAGPAGLACAAELARLGHPVVVYESREFFGGLITRGIAPYKQQIEPLPQEVEQIRRLGVEFRLGVTVGKDITAEQLRAQHAALFLGVGMGDDVAARLPGEDLPGVWESLRFIEVLKLGPAGGVRVGPRVAVIGGGNTAIDVAREAVMLWASEVTSGNTAMDVAREAIMLGASEVLMLYRRGEADMPAFAHEVAAAKREGVRIVSLVAPVEFIGTDRVRGVRCIRMKLGAPDASGRPRPEPIPGSEFVVETDTVIKAIGQKPRSDLFKHFGIEMAGSVIKIDEDCRTAAPDCFAGGDCINGGATVVEAVRDGRHAARSMHRILTGKPRAAPGVTPPPGRVEVLDGTVRHTQLDYRLTTAPRLCKGCNVCITGCPTDTLRLDAANRIVVKDVNTCVFCGLCEARCADFAIWIVKGHGGAAPSESECAT